MSPRAVIEGDLCTCGVAFVRDEVGPERHCALCGVPELSRIEIRALVGEKEVALSLAELRSLLLEGRWPE